MEKRYEVLSGLATHPGLDEQLSPNYTIIEHADEAPHPMDRRHLLSRLEQQRVWRRPQIRALGTHVFLAGTA